MDLDKIGKFLVLLRKERKLTQAQVAEAIDVSDKTVSKWERGLCLPENGTIDKLLKFYNITMMELFAGEKDQSLANTTVNETTKKAIKFHKKLWFKRTKKIILITIIIFLAILFTIFGYFTLTTYNKYNAYEIASLNTDSYNIDGNLIIAHDKIIISISNIALPEQKEKIYTKAIEYKLYINDQLIYKDGDAYNSNPQADFQNINDLLKNISIYDIQKLNTNLKVKNFEKNKLIIKIKYIDEDSNDQEISLEFSLSKTFSNNGKNINN